MARYLKPNISFMVTGRTKALIISNEQKNILIEIYIEAKYLDRTIGCCDILKSKKGIPL